MKQKERRRSLVVNKELQRRIIFSISWPMVVILVMLVGSQIAMDHSVRNGTLNVNGTLLGMPERVTSALCFFVFATLFHVMNSLKTSNRVAGASYRLSKTMKAFRRGKRSTRAILRNGDFHFELADELNAFLDWAEREMGETDAAEPAGSMAPTGSQKAAGAVTATK